MWDIEETRTSVETCSLLPKPQQRPEGTTVCVYRKWWCLKGNAALFCGARGTMADGGDTTIAGITSGLIELSRGGFRCAEEPGSQSLHSSLPLSIYPFLSLPPYSSILLSSISHPLSFPIQRFLSFLQVFLLSLSFLIFD